MVEHAYACHKKHDSRFPRLPELFLNPADFLRQRRIPNKLGILFVIDRIALIDTTAISVICTQKA
jgi:hypothetical protein